MSIQGRCLWEIRVFRFGSEQKFEAVRRGSGFGRTMITVIVATYLYRLYGGVYSCHCFGVILMYVLLSANDQKPRQQMKIMTCVET